jgi:hypothetical protein
MHAAMTFFNVGNRRPELNAHPQARDQVEGADHAVSDP